MKLVSAIILFGLLIVLGAQIYTFLGRNSEVGQDFLENKDRLEQAQLDHEKFRAELDYYLDPRNLEKELRARFNYKKLGEKLLIIVPRDQVSSSEQGSASNTGQE